MIIIIRSSNSLPFIFHLDRLFYYSCFRLAICNQLKIASYNRITRNLSSPDSWLWAHRPSSVFHSIPHLSQLQVSHFICHNRFSFLSFLFRRNFLVSIACPSQRCDRNVFVAGLLLLSVFFGGDCDAWNEGRPCRDDQVVSQTIMINSITFG